MRIKLHPCITEQRIRKILKLVIILATCIGNSVSIVKPRWEFASMKMMATTAPGYHSGLKALHQDGIDFGIRQHNRIGLHATAATIRHDQRKICCANAIVIESRQLQPFTPLGQQGS